MGRTLLLILFLVKSVWAEKTIPLPIEHQFRDASAIIHAIYKGSSYKKLPKEVILTEFSFKILNSVGIEEVRIINRNHFPVVSKGGIWHGLVYNPVSRLIFKPGEEVILFLQEKGHGYEVLNQGIGKYKIIMEKDEIFLSSSEFPGHPKLGKIKVAEFNQLVKEKFGKDLLVIEGVNIVSNNKPDIVKKPKQTQMRKISSISHTYYSDESMLFIILFLGILGAIGIKMGQSL